MRIYQAVTLRHVVGVVDIRGSSVTAPGPGRVERFASRIRRKQPNGSMSDNVNCQECGSRRKRR